MNTRKSIKNVPSYSILQIFWVALSASVLMNMVTAFLIVYKLEIETIGMSASLFYILVSISIVFLAAQIIIGRLLSDEHLFPRIHKKIVSKPSADTGIQGILIGNHANYGIILWALGTLPSLFGLFLTIFSKNISYIVGFATYSILNLLYYRPQQNKYEDQLERLRRYMETRN